MERNGQRVAARVGWILGVTALFAMGTWELIDYFRFQGRTIEGHYHSTLARRCDLVWNGDSRPVAAILSPSRPVVGKTAPLKTTDELATIAIARWDLQKATMGTKKILTPVSSVISSCHET